MTIEEKTDKLIRKINTENPKKEIEFFYNIKPEPYARPRQSSKLNGGFYNPRDKYKRKLVKLFKQDIKENKKNFKELISGEIELTLEVGIDTPVNIKKSKSKWQLVLRKFLRPITRPDIDNWCKPIMDAMNKVIYNDDGQICDLHVYKRYSDEPYISIKLRYRENPIKLR
jgi:Holliday junction resolvase RusA-like endonuclease